MRMHGHGAHDDMSYVPPEMLEEWAQRDPIERYGARLVAEHGFSEDEIEQLRAAVKAEVDECRAAGARLADARPGDGLCGRLRRGDDAARRRPCAVVALEPGLRSLRGRLMSEMTYLEAISDGLREEMRRDETVLCLGEDIGAFGGAFKVTDGFMEEFGAARVLDAPLAENAIIGDRGRRRGRGAAPGL